MEWWCETKRALTKHTSVMRTSCDAHEVRRSRCLWFYERTTRRSKYIQGSSLNQLCSIRRKSRRSEHQRSTRRSITHVIECRLWYTFKEFVIGSQEKYTLTAPLNHSENFARLKSPLSLPSSLFNYKLTSFFAIYQPLQRQYLEYL